MSEAIWLTRLRREAAEALTNYSRIGAEVNVFNNATLFNGYSNLPATPDPSDINIIPRQRRQREQRIALAQERESYNLQEQETGTIQTQIQQAHVEEVEQVRILRVID